MFQQSRWNSRIVRGSQCVATLEIVPIRIIPDCGPIRLCSRSVTCHSRHVPDHAADAALRVVQCLGCRVIPPYSAVHTNTRYLSALFSRLSDPPSILFLDTVATSSRFSHVSSVCTLDLDRWCCASVCREELAAPHSMSRAGRRNRNPGGRPARSLQPALCGTAPPARGLDRRAPHE